jgi:hypothetical protein
VEFRQDWARAEDTRFRRQMFAAAEQMLYLPGGTE